MEKDDEEGGRASRGGDERVPSVRRASLPLMALRHACHMPELLLFAPPFGGPATHIVGAEPRPLQTTGSREGSFSFGGWLRGEAPGIRAARRERATVEKVEEKAWLVFLSVDGPLWGETVTTAARWNAIV